MCDNAKCPWKYIKEFPYRPIATQGKQIDTEEIAKDIIASALRAVLAATERPDVTSQRRQI